MYTRTRWTVEDYHRMIEAGILDDRPVELLQGEIIDMSPEGPFHHYLNMSGAKYLTFRLGERALISEGHPITLSDSEPEPDIAVIRLPDTLYLTRHPYPEDIYLLVEISDSTLAKDLGVKRKLYAAAGIREYWVIDLQSRVLRVFQNPREDDHEIDRVHRDGVIHPLAFPEVAIEVKKLLGPE
jgi:Uma2 family endonuclease